MQYEVESACIRWNSTHRREDDAAARPRDTHLHRLRRTTARRASPLTGRLPSPTNYSRSAHCNCRNAESRRPMSRTVTTNSTCAGPNLLSKPRRTRVLLGQEYDSHWHWELCWRTLSFSKYCAEIHAIVLKIVLSATALGSSIAMIGMTLAVGPVPIVMIM